MDDAEKLNDEEWSRIAKFESYESALEFRSVLDSQDIEAEMPGEDLPTPMSTAGRSLPAIYYIDVKPSDSARAIAAYEKFTAAQEKKYNIHPTENRTVFIIFAVLFILFALYAWHNRF